MLSQQIPKKYVVFCSQWHNGQRSMMYAISSVGKLEIGDRKPIWANTKEEWMLGLWENLNAELYDLRYLMPHTNKEEREVYAGFVQFVKTHMLEAEQLVDKQQK